MNKRYLKYLITAQFIVLFATIIIGLVEEQYLNDSLRTYISERDNADLTRDKLFTLIIVLIFFVAYLTSSIGLLFYKKWGRWLYFYSNVCGLVLTLFMGPEIVAPISNALGELFFVLIGLTIGVIYFSDTKYLFEISIPVIEHQVVQIPPQEEIMQEATYREDDSKQPLLIIPVSSREWRPFYKDLLQNIKSGIRASVLLNINHSDFRTSVEQLLALVVVNLILFFLLNFAVVGLHGDFHYHYLPNALFYLPLMMLAAYLIARFESRQSLMLTIPIALVSASLLIEIVGALIGMITGDNWLRYFKLLYGERYYHLFVWWCIASYVAAVCLVRPFKRLILFNLTFFLVLVMPLWFIPRWDLWTESYDQKESYYAVAKEEVFYAQPVLLEQKLTALKPGRKGVIDLYFVGFGGYSLQDVFMKEINVITTLFDERFDTNGRSIELINNSQTVSKVPIATRTSLERAVKHIGKVMNTEEDIMFIYLTSHGSKEYKLSVDFWPLELNEITPEDIRKILNESGIKWKVIAVSACYSGGFIKALKDESTLVMTAADANSSSFGCSNDSDFTFFGKAYFNEALRKNYSFIGSFDEAKNTIRKRELDESKSPSNPQLYVGPAIRKQLEKLERRLQDSAKMGK